MIIIKGIDGLEEYCGKEVGVSEWHQVTQDQINQFADATNDHQWIHIDTERCQQESPYKTTIAHGFLTLSQAPFFMDQIFKIEDISMGINYGLNSVRFMSHVPVDSKIRMRAELITLNRSEQTAKTTFKLTFEIEGGSKPVCIAEMLGLIRK